MDAYLTGRLITMRRMNKHASLQGVVNNPHPHKLRSLYKIMYRTTKILCMHFSTSFLCEIYYKPETYILPEKQMGIHSHI